MLSCPLIKVSGKLQQPNPGRVTKGTDLSGVKVWVTSQVKEPRPAEVFTEVGVEEEGNPKCYRRSCDQLQKQGLLLT